MEIDIQEIRVLASRNPHMRINTLLHHLEKRQKVEELKQAQYRHMTGKSALQQAVDEMKREPSLWERLMGRNG